MSIQVALTHRTAYSYDRLVQLGPQIVRLRPAPHSRTRILSYSLKITPTTHFLNWQQDPQGNWLARIVFPEKTDQFSILIDLIADMTVVNPFDFFLEEEAEKWPFVYDPSLDHELRPFRLKEPAGPKLAAWLATVPRSRQRTIDMIVGLNQRLSQDIKYVIRMEPGVQRTEETLVLRKGSCRDSSWLLVQILRHLGFAARFVSGYLIQLVADQKPLEGPEGPSADFTDLHAWCEVYLPGAGWVGLDPTSGLLAGEGHIPLAATPDPQTAAPISGLVEDASVSFSFDMTVRRILETPRVTKPYTDPQWAEIEALGHAVDARLVADDVRLTMGGEPTFVGIDDPDAPEWNTAAVGPTKRERAATLIEGLRKRYAPNGLLHFGQGKWYPGESLPRWAFSLIWRGDGKPLWRDESLLDTDAKAASPVSEHHAERLARGIAESLGLSPTYVVPAFEDTAAFLLKEAQLPENVDPTDSKLDDPEERARLARVFDRGLGKPAGYVLPIQRWQARASKIVPGTWRSERWSSRRGKLFLVPGDSPVGHRLPLNALPFIPPARYPYFQPRDPFAPKAPLPDPGELPERRAHGVRHRADVQSWARERQDRVEQDLEDDFEDTLESGNSIRTALTVEPRDGRLCVFLPPTSTTEDYVELINAVEAAAHLQGTPVMIEGYMPPADERLNIIKVTPDPGVIEVNIHPAHSWDELVANTEALYDEARRSRLETEKFMIDGRHTGTGGGNHVVVGGARAEDSPFLRRPDLLASLLAYWQNHPSLSFLFSGLFIGPTSQAPRIDEARDDQLYELELALAQVPEPVTLSGGTLPYWLVDRIFRNLLIDVTGNTHRSEICIDKLYSPDGPTGRLGLVEFRNFEMPPHARMSLAQQALLRALIAWFWRVPYRRPLIRWGTALHDRFMLSHFVWRDFSDVVDDLKSAGFPFDLAWYAPHLEFRFPSYGTVEYEGVTLELRQALEPWHVMGEEGAVGGTARYVDSSLERLEVKLTGAIAERHAILCNGVTVPLAPAGRTNEFVAGIRFRAWQPASSLHPTIPIDSPLVFDVVDRMKGRALGGCTYYVSHPGGRSYDTLPVNSLEAEARRRARFSAIGHTAGPLTVPPLERTAEFPLTLDLRRSHVRGWP